VVYRAGAVRPVEYKVEVPVVKFAIPLIEKSEPGVVVPMPTLPFPRTLKRVALVEEATAKSEVVPLPVVEETESCENGVVVPIPIAEVVAEEPMVGWVHASYEAVMVGETDPTTVKAEQEARPEQEADEVATD
jgi:hypothetical protein